MGKGSILASICSRRMRCFLREADRWWRLRLHRSRQCRRRSRTAMSCHPRLLQCSVLCDSKQNIEANLVSKQHQVSDTDLNLNVKGVRLTYVASMRQKKKGPHRSQLRISLRLASVSTLASGLITILSFYQILSKSRFYSRTKQSANS